MFKHFPYISFAFATSGTVVIMIALAFAFVPDSGVVTIPRLQSPKPNIVALASNAFGSLAGAADQSAGARTEVAYDGAANAAPAPSAVPGVQGSGSSGISSLSATAVDVKVAPSAPTRLIAPSEPYVPVRYRYVYDGEPIEAPAESMDVYRRAASPSFVRAPANILQSAGLGAANLGSFQRMQMQNVSFVEDRDDGYIVTTDFQNGTISINENWDRKTNDPYRCVNGRCPQVEPLAASAMLADAEMLRIADEFLAAHGVNLSLYGTPVVDHSWRMYVDYGGDLKASDGVAVQTIEAVTDDRAIAEKPAIMPIRAPEQVSVTYPYLVEGREIRSQSGDPVGMSVAVNVRTRAISSAWGISIQSYEKSPYATEQDTERIMSFVERGGIYTYVEPNAKIIDVELAAPSVELAVFGHQAADGRWEDLYVPSLVFPIAKKPADAPWMQNSIVIPLIKEVLVDPKDSPIRIMKEGDVGGTVTVAPPPVDIMPAPAAR